MEIGIDKNLLAIIQEITKGANNGALKKSVGFFCEQEDEVLTDEEWAAIQEDREDVAQGRVVSLEEYEKARGF